MLRSILPRTLRPFAFRRRFYSSSTPRHQQDGKQSLLNRITNPGPPLLARYPFAYRVFTWMRYGALFSLLFHITVSYFYEISWTWGISMLPTLSADGAAVLISKYYRRGRGVEIGDLVSYAHPLKPGYQAIKRVVGLEGDFVARDSPHKGSGAMIQIPRGHCYVVGDNLEHSRDSRMFGPLPLNLIKGKVVCGFGRLFGWFPWPPVPLPETMVDAKEEDWDVTEIPSGHSDNR